MSLKQQKQEEPSNDVKYSVESKKALSLEGKLEIALSKILLEIVRQYPITTATYSSQYQQIYNEKYDQVYAAIRTNTQKAYEIGADYVTKKMDTSSYLTDDDVGFIADQAEKNTERFFGRLRTVMEHSTEKYYESLLSTPGYSIDMDDEEQVQFYKHRIENSKSYLFSSVAVAVVSGTLNAATMRKAQALNKNYQLMGEMIFLWRASFDERTCMICDGLNDTVYEVNDYFMPEPIDSTHYNCRCRVLLVNRKTGQREY